MPEKRKPKELPYAQYFVDDDHKVTKFCWYCSRTDVIGTAYLYEDGVKGARIDVCSPGVGCRDGRIYHGPPGPAPHWPEQPCRACDRRKKPRPDDDRDPWPQDEEIPEQPILSEVQERIEPQPHRRAMVEVFFERRQGAEVSEEEQQ